MLNGARQSGKTTLVKDIAKEFGMDYITLDDPPKLNLAQIDPKNFQEFYAKKALVIDEIQLAPQLIPYLKTRVDSRDEKGMFLLTGSADFMRMQKITDSLAGRMVRYKLHPLSNAEIGNRDENIVEQLFDREFGGLHSHASLMEVLQSTIRGGVS